MPPLSPAQDAPRRLRAGGRRPSLRAMTRCLCLAAVFALSGCASPSLQGLLAPQDAAAAPAAPEETAAAPPETLDPTPPPPPPPEARTADQFDTTSDADRAEALTAPDPQEAGAERALGTTIASLGDPTDPGIWLKTPLVTDLTEGRVENPATGKSVTLELRPSGGEPGAGSQISLPALRLLEIPLTELPELAVFAG